MLKANLFPSTTEYMLLYCQFCEDNVNWERGNTRRLLAIYS